MQSSGTTSVVELTADVNNLAEQLNELKQQLYADNKNEFSSKFCNDAEQVTAALKDLDSERILAHDVLEVETIRASVLRHALNNYASRLKAEIKAVVSSARDSNASLIKELQGKLTIMGQSAQKLVKKHEVMELHNAILKPELAQLHKEHAEKRTILNTKMAERAGMKIILNETEAALKDVNAQIAEIEEVIRLAELDLESHTEQVHKEKAEILVQLDYIQAKLYQQMEENTRLSMILTQLEHEETTTSLVRQDSQRYHQEVEASLQEILGKEKMLKAVIKGRDEQLLSMKTEKEKLEKDINSQEKKYEALKEEHSKTTTGLNIEIKKAEDKASKLTANRAVVAREYRKAKDAMELQAGALADIRQNVASCKKVLMSESEEGVVLESRVKELEYQLLQLREAHKVTVQLHKEQIVEYKEKTSEAKTKRAVIEDSYNKLQADIQAEMDSHKEKMKALAALKEDQERENDIMLQRYVQLTEAIQDREKNIVASTETAQSSNNRLHHTRVNLEAKIGRLEDKVAELQEQYHDHVETINTLQPKALTLTEEYDDLSVKYEAKKKEIIALKNKKTGLHEMCQRLERELENLRKPQQSLRIGTMRERACVRQVMREQRRRATDMERNAAERKQRLYQIDRENNRFKKVSHINNDHAPYLVSSPDYPQPKYKRRSLGTRLAPYQTLMLQMEYDKCIIMERQLDKWMNEIKELLLVQWKKNQELEKMYSDRHRVTVGEMNTAIIDASNRLEQLAVLYSRFQVEMEKFNKFLGAIGAPLQKKD